MKYTAISCDGRIITCEIGDDGVKICRRQSHDGPEECIEAKDRRGVEAYGIKRALEKWWHEGWTITAEES